MNFDSGLLCDFNTTLPKMLKKLFSLFWQQHDVLHTRKVFFKYMGELLLLHWYHTLDGGWNQTEVLRDVAATYDHVTIYNRHLIMPTHHFDILLQRLIKFCHCDKMLVC